MRIPPFWVPEMFGEKVFVPAGFYGKMPVVNFSDVFLFGSCGLGESGAWDMKTLTNRMTVVVLLMMK